jgi:cell wall-associated NlpC family hydrolase
VSSFVRAAASLLVAAAILGTVAPADAHEPADYRTERDHVVTRARRQLGTPYRSGGSSPGGFDCSGFTQWVYRSHGANLPHSAAAQFELAGRKGYKRIWNRRSLEVGDLVFHRTTSARVGHAGIYIGRGRFISSTSSRGVKIDSLYDRYYWGSRWVGATRLPATMRYRPDRPNGPHGAQLA